MKNINTSLLSHSISSVVGCILTLIFIHLFQTEENIIEVQFTEPQSNRTTTIPNDQVDTVKLSAAELLENALTKPNLTQEELETLLYNAGLEERISEFEKNQLPEYEQLFHELGLEGEDLKNVLNQRKDIFIGAIESGDSRMKLIKNKRDYKRYLKEKLGADVYTMYENHERLKPAIRTSDAINEKILEQTSFPMKPEELDELAQLIHEHDISNSEHWDGPFDSLPDPRTGEMAIQKLMEVHDDLATKLEDFEIAVNNNPILSNYAETITTYYTDAIEGMAMAFDNSFKTPEERWESISNRVNEKIEEKNSKVINQPVYTKENVFE